MGGGGDGAHPFDFCVAPGLAPVTGPAADAASLQHLLGAGLVALAGTDHPANLPLGLLHPSVQSQGIVDMSHQGQEGTAQAVHPHTYCTGAVFLRKS